MVFLETLQITICYRIRQLVQKKSELVMDQKVGQIVVLLEIQRRLTLTRLSVCCVITSAV